MTSDRDPPRWFPSKRGLDDSSEIAATARPPFAASLEAGAAIARSWEPTPEQRERIRHALHRRLAEASADPSNDEVPLSTAQTSMVSLLTKPASVTTALALLVAVGVAIWWFTTRIQQRGNVPVPVVQPGRIDAPRPTADPGAAKTDPPPLRPAAAPAPAPATGAPEREPESPWVHKERARPSQKRPPRTSSPATSKAPGGAVSSAVPGDGFELLAHAQRLVGSRPEDALALIREHEQNYPDSEYAMQRDTIRIEALVVQNDRAGAEGHARAFLTKYRNSTNTLRIKELLKKSHER